MVFSEVALKALHDFRKVAKRYFSQKERDKLFVRLELNRNRSGDSDYELWETADKIRRSLQTLIKERPKGYYSYSGIEQYYSFLKDFLDKYLVITHRVVHKAQRASCLMLNIIQVACLPRESLTKKISENLKRSCCELALMGSEEQRLNIHALLNAKCEENPEFFDEVLQCFIQFKQKVAKNSNSEVAA